MTHADGVHALQFLGRPHTTRGVVRVAEQEDGRLLVGTFRLEVGPVDREYRGCGGTGVRRYETGLQHLAAVVADGGEEAVVVGRQDEHLLAGHRQRLDGHRHGRHDTRGIKDFLATDGPLVATLEPRDDRLVVVVAHMGIAEHAVLSPLADGLLNGRCRLEVHVGHPEGNDIVRRET